jgi:hypothetical protein
MATERLQQAPSQPFPMGTGDTNTIHVSPNQSPSSSSPSVTDLPKPTNTSSTVNFATTSPHDETKHGGVHARHEHKSTHAEEEEK